MTNQVKKADGLKEFEVVEVIQLTLDQFTGERDIGADIGAQEASIQTPSPKDAYAMHKEVIEGLYATPAKP
ncbi:hypothetical protein FS837_002078 [Tulasnella sp. UAMH 9824]|nr:hypothetical protein FS837_002078 [Tulasnella sp. UAMH 9824]